MPYSKGRTFSLVCVAFGFVAATLGIYVLSTCEFYQVTWTSTFGITQTDKPGIFLCKSYNSPQHPKWTGPENGFDTAALLGGFGGVIMGTLATVMVLNAYWQCFCRLPPMAGCLFMMATILQLMTALVYVSSACGEGYDGTCKFLFNAYLSFGSALCWLLASCFNRDATGRPEDDDVA